MANTGTVSSCANGALSPAQGLSRQAERLRRHREAMEYAREHGCTPLQAERLIQLAATERRLDARQKARAARHQLTDEPAPSPFWWKRED